MNSIMSVRRAGAVMAVAALATLAACGGKDDEPVTASSKRLSIATGPTTGVYYPLGGAFARVISKSLDMKATATETGASVQNVHLVVAGKQDVAFSLLDTAADAVNGVGPFEGVPQPIEALTGLYPNYTQVVVRTDSGIDSIAEMKGKTVATGAPQSGTEVIAERLLGDAGLDPEADVQRQRLNLDKSVEGMKDGAIDAMFWSGGIPTPGVEDLFTSLEGKVRLLDLTQHLDGLRTDYGDVYEEGKIPADTYGGDAVGTIVVQNVLFVKKGFDPKLGERLVRLLFDRKADLVSAAPAAEGITPERARVIEPLRFNTGAEKALAALR